MRTRDTLDALTSGMAAAADALAILGSFLLATWIRFDSGLIPVKSRPPSLYAMYGWGAVVATLLFVVLFKFMSTP